jgi:TetR/AcrR family transcriptional regulator, lmrAB and yxaGH operons repressor
MPRPPSDAREKIIDATIRLLRRGGLSASGINDVLALSGAPKGSLYHYFPGGKHQMVSEALTRYQERVADQFTAAMSGSAGRLQSRVARVCLGIEQKMQATQFRESCAVGAVLLDLDEADEALREQCQLILEAWAQILKVHLPEVALARRPLAARQLISMIEGAQMMARVTRDPQPLRDIAPSFARAFG